jgi:signal transduction histidine kinase
VSDNGIGIDRQHCDLVFEPFKKLNGHLYPGAGLGLTLARTIVVLHSGSIWIEPATPGVHVFFVCMCSSITVEVN